MVERATHRLLRCIWGLKPWSGSRASSVDDSDLAAADEEVGRAGEVKTYLFHANEIVERMIRVMFDEGSREITSPDGREERMVFPKGDKVERAPHSAIFGNKLFNGDTK
jgi:hypothetical protein